MQISTHEHAHFLSLTTQWIYTDRRLSVPIQIDKVIFISLVVINNLPCVIGLVWVGLDWIGLGWLGLSWIGLDWIGLGWFGLAWIGLGWLGLSWLGLGWLGLVWVGFGCLGLDWVGLGWLGLVWVGFGCLGLDWVGRHDAYIEVSLSQKLLWGDVEDTIADTRRNQLIALMLVSIGSRNYL
jgi:hypothetical protein